MTGSNRRSLRQGLSHGLLLFNKMPGVTSFDSLAVVKKIFATGKVGHTGTLDKFASGLLLVLVGRGVKLIPLFKDFTKEYTATILFGEETDTLDPEGNVIAEAEVPSQKTVEAVLENFRGDILQSPPAYSAKHINGRRSYELAREGKEPEMKMQKITVHELSVLSWTPPEACIRVRVSSGTYIRSLARDIALAAGSRAHLSALKRDMVGPFLLEDAVDKDNPDINGALHPINVALFEKIRLPCFFVDPKAEEGFMHGKSLEGLFSKEELSMSAEASAEAAGVFARDKGDFLGFLERKNGKWSYGYVFAGN
jgi:tRNA pseudouridine55 synthase